MIAYQQFAADVSEDVFTLMEYVDALAYQMGLGEWAFTVEVGSIEAGVKIEGMTPAGMVEVYPGAKHATITLDLHWKQWTPEFLRETVVHELCHLFFNPVQDLIQATESSVGQMFLTPLTTAMNHLIEQEVDRMSRRWAGFLPLMPPDEAPSAFDPNTHYETPV